ncbi:MAG: hypothetical protein QF364_01060 [Candidatus Poseidoniaceae archaeon]|nr:hypothetical protein [Candidatus Poseidoniaceae archaeon]
MVRRKLNLLMWPLAFLIINSLWVGISDNAAPYEINDYEHSIETRTVNLDSVLGQDRPMPATFEFHFSGEGSNSGLVSWKIIDSSQQTVAEWSGMLDDEPKAWDGELKPGNYRVETTADEGILTEQILYIQPFSSYALEGHFALSILLVLVAFAESIVRKKSKQYFSNKGPARQQLDAKAPFKRLNTGPSDDDLLGLDESPWRTPKGL